MTRRRPELEFDLESKLLGVLENEARSLVANPFAKRGAKLLVVREPALGNTIPDLVIVRTFRRRPDTRKVMLTAFESWIVGELMRTGELGEACLTQKLFTPIESTRSALQKLEKVGMIRRTSSGTYRVKSNYSAHFKIVSVEAKLTRWQMALQQAKSYLRFSDESFVALPASVIEHNVKIATACVSEGVGLIAVSKTDIHIVIKPTAAPEPDLREWTWLLAKTGSLHL